MIQAIDIEKLAFLKRLDTVYTYALFIADIAGQFPNQELYPRNTALSVFPGLKLPKNYKYMFGNNCLINLAKTLVNNRSNYGNISECTIDAGPCTNLKEFDFESSGRSDFYTSYHEFQLHFHLTPNDIIGLRTGIFTFNGTNQDNPQFVSGIIRAGNRDIEIKQVHIYDSIISATKFAAFLPYDVVNLSLINVELGDGFCRKSNHKIYKRIQAL